MAGLKYVCTKATAIRLGELRPKVTRRGDVLTATIPGISLVRRGDLVDDCDIVHQNASSFRLATPRDVADYHKRLAIEEENQ